MRLFNLRKSIVAALLAAGVILPRSAFAADLKTNLVVNHGFENVDVNDPGPFTSARLLDWIDTDGDFDDTFAYPYSSLYSGTPGPPGAADYHFAGGFNVLPGDVLIEQTFDVSTGDSGALIATGTARYDLRAFFSSYRSQSDVTTVRASFLDGGSNVVGSIDVGGPGFLGTIPVRFGQRMWGNDARFGIIPATTRNVRIEMIGGVEGTNHDGYVDNVDFRVGGLSDDATLKLEINASNGFARLRNLTGTAIDFNYYEVTSASGGLNPERWNSLQDQDFEGSGGVSGTGDGWEEGGGASANGVSEAFLLGSSILSSPQSVSLGGLYRLGSDRDLVMRFGLENGLLLQGYVDFVTDFGVSGDFDNNGLYQCSDIDSLSAAIVSGTNNPAFDLTGDGRVSSVDLTAWRIEAGRVNLPNGAPYLQGDANLDGVVDGSDFGIWNTNKFTSVAAWCSGDFNADGAVDGSDFGIWNTNKFTSADGVATVPEPLGGSIAIGLFVAWSSLFRRRSTPSPQ